MLSGLDGSQRVVGAERHKERSGLNFVRSAHVDEISAASESSNVTLRPHQPGDMGWVIDSTARCTRRNTAGRRVRGARGRHRRGVHSPVRPRTRTRVDRGAQRSKTGMHLLVAKNRTTAKLRLLLVRPDARAWASDASWCPSACGSPARRVIARWCCGPSKTSTAARHLYAEAGFKKAAEEPNHNFGKDLISETWELRL